MKFIIWWVSWNVVSDVAMKENLCKTKTEVGEWCFQYFMMALAALSLSNNLLGGVLSYMMRFAAFMPRSALPLDCGYSADDKWCFTPHLYKKLLECCRI